MNSEVSDKELLIRRTFDAPASLVFAMWSDPEHFGNWVGPETFTCPVVEMDFRVGGKYRAMIRSEENGENWFGGEYREIEENRKLVFTFTWDSGGPSDGLETLITIVFREHNGKTEQSFHQAPFIDVERRDSHVGGWTSAFDKEADYLKRIVNK